MKQNYMNSIPHAVLSNGKLCMLHSGSTWWGGRVDVERGVDVGMFALYQFLLPIIFLIDYARVHPNHQWVPPWKLKLYRIPLSYEPMCTCTLCAMLNKLTSALKPVRDVLITLKQCGKPFTWYLYVSKRDGAIQPVAEACYEHPHSNLS